MVEELISQSFLYFFAYLTLEAFLLSVPLIIKPIMGCCYYAEYSGPRQYKIDFGEYIVIGLSVDCTCIFISRHLTIKVQLLVGISEICLLPSKLKETDYIHKLETLFNFL